MAPITELELPRNALLHFRQGTVDQTGPSPNDSLFANITKPIWVKHVVELHSLEGKPRRLGVSVDAMIRKFHMTNRRFKLLKEVEAVKDQLSLAVLNYALIDNIYRYQRTQYTDYYRWQNLESLVWENVARAAELTDRDQYVFIDIPTVLPSASILKMGESLSLTTKLIKLFPNDSSRFLLELWKWLGENRSASMLSKIPEDKLNRVNLVYVDTGKWFVVNLGVMNGWRCHTKEEIEKDAELSEKGTSPIQLQKYYLRMMAVAMSFRSGGGNSADILNEEGVPETPGDDEEQISDDHSKLLVIGATPSAFGGKTTKEGPLPAQARPGSVNNPESVVDELQLPSMAEVDKDLAQLEKISQRIELAKSQEAEAIDLYDRAFKQDLEQGVRSYCDSLAEIGRVSAAEYKRYIALSRTYKTLKSPDGKTTLDKYVQVSTEELAMPESKQVPDIPQVADKTMLKSSLLEFDSKYIENTMGRDIAASVLNFQNAGIAVTNYEVEHVETIMGKHDNYSVQFVPVNGKPSTVCFTLPSVDENGVFEVNGSKYRMRKQIGDLPIHKVGPNRVALTSYYGKVFVCRSEKRVNDYGAWLRNRVAETALMEDSPISEFNAGNVFDHLFEAPKLYTTLSMGYISFQLAGFQFVFDHVKREQMIDKSLRDMYEADGSIVAAVEVGKKAGAQPKVIVLDKFSNILLGEKGVLSPFKSFEEMLGVESAKAPVDCATMKVLGRDIPVGIILAYQLGLEKLIASLKIEVRRVEAGKQVKLLPSEYGITFEDETLVFDRDDKIASLILGGFREYKDAIRLYSVYEFNQPHVYLNVLEAYKLSNRHLKEIQLINELFIDPITRELLMELNEPTTFRGILMRAVELLQTDYHPEEIDPAYMRKKGYERFAGAVYSEIVKAVRMQRSRLDNTKPPIELNPMAVLMNITQDPSKILLSEINPIQNLKEIEAVTFGGVGGRTSRSMTKHTRAYHKNDMGVISEATVDSGDVGINVFTSADPQFSSQRGLSRGYEIGKTGATALLSTSALLAPGALNDDPKRVGFISIQNSHSMACVGARAPMVRTGYEYVMAHRTGPMFATTAKKAGKVVSVSDTGIIIEYDDGKKVGIELGRRFGKAQGLTVPHELTTDMRVGQKFKEGAIISYNKGFFERDTFNKDQAVFKIGFYSKVALLEDVRTLEDSSAVSSRVAEKLKTTVAYTRDIIVGFKDSIHKLVKVGDELESDSILCVIEDEVSARNGGFSDEAMTSLQYLSAQVPRAKHTGHVERVEVYYNGEKEDMSASLRTITNASDKMLTQRNKSVGGAALDGGVDDSFRVEGDPLPADAACIRIYMTHEQPAGIGDKVVFANQNKSVISDVFENEIVSETGVKVDALFSGKSIYNRIVTSPYIIGTTATLLKEIAKKAVAAYNNVK